MYHKGDLDGTITKCTHAIQFDDDDEEKSEPLALRAKAYLRKGDADACLADLQAIRPSDKIPKPQKNMVKSLLAIMEIMPEASTPDNQQVRDTLLQGKFKDEGKDVMIKDLLQELLKVPPNINSSQTIQPCASSSLAKPIWKMSISVTSKPNNCFKRLRRN